MMGTTKGHLFIYLLIVIHQERLQLATSLLLVFGLYFIRFDSGPDDI